MSTLWMAHFTLNGISEHLLMLRGSPDRTKIEKVLQRVEDNYRDNFPNSTIEITKLEQVETLGQVEQARRQLYSRNPNRIDAKIMFPDNPNLLLFRNPPKQDAHESLDQTALIDFLCGGGF